MLLPSLTLDTSPTGALHLAPLLVGGYSLPGASLPPFVLDATHDSYGELPSFTLTDAGPTELTIIGAGGVSVDGEAARSFVLDGVTLYDNLIAVIPPATDGVVIGGAAGVEASTVLQFELYPLGGTVVSGAANVSSTWVRFVPSGGTTVSGEATVESVTAAFGYIGASLPALGATLAVTTLSGELAPLTCAIAADSNGVGGKISAKVPAVTMASVSTIGSVALIDATTPRIGMDCVGGMFYMNGTVGYVDGSFDAISVSPAVIDAEAPLITAELFGTIVQAGTIESDLPSLAIALASAQGALAQLTGTTRSVQCAFSAYTENWATISGVVPTPHAQLVGVSLGASSVSMEATLPNVRGAMTLRRLSWY